MSAIAKATALLLERDGLVHATPAEDVAVKEYGCDDTSGATIRSMIADIQRKQRNSNEDHFAVHHATPRISVCVWRQPDGVEPAPPPEWATSGEGDTDIIAVGVIVAASL